MSISVQELSTRIRNGSNPTIVLINNSGYTSERVYPRPCATLQRYLRDLGLPEYAQILRCF